VALKETCPQTEVAALIISKSKEEKKMKKLSTILIAMLILATVLSACDIGGSQFDCEDPLGCVTYAPDEPIRVATSLVISGPNTELGMDSQHGVEIAGEFRGEVVGHPIEFQFEDDLCSSEGGQTSAQKVVSDPTILAMIGTSCSGAGVPAAKIISDAGYVMVSPSNTSPALTDPDQHQAGYLRTAHNDKVQGRAMANFALNELGVKTAAAIHDGDPYTEGLARVFADSFVEMGGEIVAFEAAGKGDTDMRPLLKTVAEAGPPEFIYYPIFIAEGAAITTQAAEVSGLENTILAGADGMQSPSFLEAAGDSAEDMYLSGPDLGFSGSIYQDFLAKYQQNYGTEPTAPFHAHSYDAANMIFDAIERAAIVDEDGTVHVGRQALRDALYATSGLVGITGTITCDSYGDCADARISVNQVQGGEFVKIWP
jgi:branched-chain amino acid transport system substrate-binding protein